MLRVCTCLKKAEVTFRSPLLYNVILRYKQHGTLENKEVTSEEKFETIYKFPYIRPLVFVNRLKVYQSIIAGLTIPVAATLFNFSVIDWNTALATCSFSVTACFPLYGLSFFIKNFVGFIYTNDDGTKTKVAYVDYWGKRVDVYIDSNDIIPFSEQPRSVLQNLYMNISRYSTKDELKVNLQFAEILNKDKFTKLFSKPAVY